MRPARHRALAASHRQGLERRRAFEARRRPESSAPARGFQRTAGGVREVVAAEARQDLPPRLSLKVTPAKLSHDVLRMGIEFLARSCRQQRFHHICESAYENDVLVRIQVDAIDNARPGYTVCVENMAAQLFCNPPILLRQTGAPGSCARELRCDRPLGLLNPRWYDDQHLWRRHLRLNWGAAD